jgi:CheY-like chemotaxis protein
MQKKGPLLLIEDDQAIQESLAWVLEHEGYTVHSAGHGKEGLAYLKRSISPSVILLDIMMPVMDGFAFRHILQQDPVYASIPLIVMSADKQLGINLPQTEHEYFLNKPLNLDKLLKIVAQYN